MKKSTIFESIKITSSFLITDTPPSLGIMTVNAFATSDEIIIPTTAGIFAAKGITQLWRTHNMVKDYCNPNLKIAGILLTRFNPRLNINRDIKNLTETIGKEIGAPVFKTHIRASVAVDEAQANRLDIFSHNKNNPVSQDYDNLVAEYLSNKGVK